MDQVEVSGEGSSSRGGGSGGGKEMDEMSGSGDMSLASLTWPMFHHHRGQVRSCIELTGGVGSGLTDVTPTNGDGPASLGESSNVVGGGMGDLRTSCRLSNPFLEDILARSGSGEWNFDEDGPSNNSQSHSLSLSLLSNEDGDSESDGTLSEVFDTLSRFSEICLASAEGVTRSSSAGGNCRAEGGGPGGEGQGGSGSALTLPVSKSGASTHLCYDAFRLRKNQDGYEAHHHHNGSLMPCTNENGRREGRRPEFFSGNQSGTHFVRNEDSTPTMELPAFNRLEKLFATNPPPTSTGMGEEKSFAKNREAAQPLSLSSNRSRVWSDYGSGGSDAGNNSSLSILGLRGVSSALDGPGIAFRGVSEGGRGGCWTEKCRVDGSLLVSARESCGPVAATCLDWQERCMELEVALQRFGEQAARVRLLLRDKLAELEQRVVEAEGRADEAEDKVRVMEQQLSEATSNAGSWTMGEEEKLCTLENTVREKERVISRLECQVEEQRLLRLQESRKVEEKAAKIKDWVSNKLRDLEEQNEHLRTQNQKCETQLDLLRSRLAQLSQLNTLHATSKGKDRHSTEDSSRGSYEGDRPPSDESPPPDSGDAQVIVHQTPQVRPMSATAACLAAIRRRSGAFDTPEERRLRRKSNLSSVTNTGTTNGVQSAERRSETSRSSRVDSGSVDMETPQSLSPRSPLDALEALDASLPPFPNGAARGMSASLPCSSAGGTVGSLHLNGHASRNSASSNGSLHNGSSSSNNNHKNNNHVIISSPSAHPVPSPVPVTIPTPISISQSVSPATPMDGHSLGGAESTQSLTLNSDRRVPIVPPRKCRTRSPTPKSSNGTTPGQDSPHVEEEDSSVLRARLDAECQQLARDLQAAVQELVRPELPLGRARAMDEIHDYSEIYTPSCENPEGLPLGSTQPPPPPIHRFPSWESRIYEVAAGGLKVPAKTDPNLEDIDGIRGHHTSNNSLGLNFSIPVYTTVKGRASQIRSAPFSGDSSDSSDGEDIASGSGGSGPSHPLSSAGDTDISSPGKSAASSLANSLSPTHRSSTSPSKSYRREPSMLSETSDDYAIPPDAYASETNSMDIALSAGCQTINLGLSTLNVNRGSSSGMNTLNSLESSPRKESLEKTGYLTKLGGKLKTWRKRWFVLKNGTLTYWKTSQDVNRRSTGREILLDENCRITKGDGAGTFEISTGKKTYYLTADSVATVDEWVRILQNVVRRNATKLVLSMEDCKPTLQGWLTKVKNGHPKRCWCVLIGKMFLTFKSSSDSIPSGQINMKDARVRDVDHKSDSDNEDKDDNILGDNFNDSLTVEIIPSHQSPVYLHFMSKQDKDAWLYHLTVVSGKGPSAGTQFEQAIHKLMEVDGDPNCSLWKNPLLLHSKESITSPLTSLSSIDLQNEAVKLFKSCQLFMSVPLEPSAIDYHVGLAQNTLQLCLDHPELQAELICALVKQTSRSMTLKNGQHGSRTLHKLKHSRFLNATHSLFVSDSTSNHTKINSHNTSTSKTSNGSAKKSQSQIPSPSLTSPSRSLRGGSGRSSPASNGKLKGSSSVPSSPLLSQNHSMHHHALSSESKSNIRTFVFIQGWQLLALAVSLFLPKNSKLLWYLKQHLQRNVDTKSETGKYAAYCQRSIERTLANGARVCKPSRMEVLSILMKNPFHHSLPHSVPVHFLNGTYQVVGFDGSTIVEEFLLALCHQTGCREPIQSGFALCEDDPFEKDLQLTLRPSDKICDVISQWETTLREKAGKFETRRAVTLSFVSRIYRRSGILQETEKERLLLCYQTNQAVVSGRFPLTKELAVELAALMAQIDTGDYKTDKTRGSNNQQMIAQTLDKYYPVRYRENLSQDEFKALCDMLVEKWGMLKGKSCLDCVRIYLTCTRKWPFFGATLFSAKVRGTHIIEDGTVVWAAICEDGIAVLDSANLQQIGKYSYTTVQTFGGVLQEDCFMVVIDDLSKKRRILFTGMSKHKVYEMTQLVAEYYNAQHQHSMYGLPSQTGSSALTRHNSLKSSRFYHSSNTLPPSTPRLDRKIMRNENGHAHSGTPLSVQRCDSVQMTRSPKL